MKTLAQFAREAQGNLSEEDVAVAVREEVELQWSNAVGLDGEISTSRNGDTTLRIAVRYNRNVLHLKACVLEKPAVHDPSGLPSTTVGKLAAQWLQQFGWQHFGTLDRITHDARCYRLYELRKFFGGYWAILEIEEVELNYYG